ncbi:sacsin N-terminal ATP-binding-like domain-containing protein [Brevundimonas sp. G8]|uniref:sacsin N-terminal ATP-binding-like domain-containing protein n=1 Tax=Brevundimonas sp. G8 TaxID=1350776 RepID=UPI0012F28343|nr:hypothetical protein [Brevundimonas sp. G8]VXB53847.1 conserved hypothetical protein [Brevundimonas sp. G8]
MTAVVDSEDLAGRQAADRLSVEWPDTSWAPTEPSPAWARGAVGRFAELVRDQPAIFRASQKNAERKAKSLSPRPFQGLTETLQNANDLGATVVRFAYEGGTQPRLHVVHDGKPVTLKDMGAMVMPWLSSKEDDDEASGRFGIGQKTLQALGGPIAMHCEPYHFEMRSDHPVGVAPPAAIPGVYDPGARETMVSLPLLTRYDVKSVEVAVAEMGVESLLFLNSVRRLEFHDLESGKPTTSYAIKAEVPISELMVLGDIKVDVEISRLQVSAPEDQTGRAFIRYWARRPVPAGEERIDKNTGAVTPLGLCVEQGGAGEGHLFDRVRMPVKMRFPVNLNAQFDPDAARTTIMPLQWNESRFKDLGALLGSAALIAFDREPSHAWSHAPLRPEVEGQEGWVAERLEVDVADQARDRLMGELRLPDQDGDRRPLDAFVYETADLDGLLTPDDQIAINIFSAVLTEEHRDSGGRWRDVLSELGQSRELDFDDALDIFEHPDRINGREPNWFVRMAALAGRSGSIPGFLLHRSILLADGSVVRAPAQGGAKVLVRSGSADSLAVRLGLALPLHPAYLGEDDVAVEACAAFAQAGVLVDSADSPDDALALLGQASPFLGENLAAAVDVSDADLLAIRDAWARKPRDDQRALAGRIGRNIRIRAIYYDGRSVISDWTRPVELYMPFSIDKESDAFAKIADRTPGLKWADPGYSLVLKQAGGRSEVGARRFLSALGVATAPRLTAPVGERAIYARDSRKVSALNVPNRPRAQTAAVRALEATHLMSDRWSPDIEAVVADIRSAPSKVRRKRSLDLLALLARNWERRYAEHQSAEAVSGYNGSLRKRGEVQSTWLAQLAEAEWLPHGGGGFAAPGKLCLPTPANRLAHGTTRSAFLATVATEVSNSGLLTALGVRKGPTTVDLVDRLRAYQGEALTEGVRQQVHGIYQLLADSLRASKSEAAMGRSLTPQQLRNAFRSTATARGLVLAQDGWHAPEAVFSGPQVFGSLRPFAPHIAGLEVLWSRLEVQAPGPNECVQVLRELAAEPLTPARKGVMLSTLRRLAETFDQATPQLRARLNTLPLWSGSEWSKERPAFAFEGEGLADADVATAIVWRPGLSSFQGLEAILPALGVTLLRLENFTPVQMTTLGLASGREHRRRFGHAVSLLDQALIRSDVALHESLSVAWPALQSAEFLLEPELEIEAALDGKAPIRFAAGAHLSLDARHFVARSLNEAGDAQAGGQAIASLFDGDRQKVAWAWSSVWARATADQAEAQIVLPQLKVEQAGGLERLEQLKASAEGRAKGKAGAASPPKPKAPPARQPKIEVRQLRDLSTLQPTQGTIVNQGVASQGVVFPKPKMTDLSRTFTRPNLGTASRPPGKRSVLPPANDREAMALDAIRRALQLDPEQFRDVRERRGLGVDAIDEMRHLYELKMTSGPKFLDEVNLEASQVKAAIEEPDDFFLALVAGLEDGEGELRVRFIFRPLEKLQTRIPAVVTLTGVDTVEALEYVFVKADPGQDG